MPCASTVCASWRNAARCSRRSTIRGCWQARQPCRRHRPKTMDDDELLAQLGVDAAGASDITELRHVRTGADKRAAEEIANREKCEDFERFKPLFEQVQKELESGVRQTRPFELKAEIDARQLVHRRRPESLCRRDGRDVHQRAGRTDARLARDLRQRHREQHAHALAPAGAQQGRGRPADHRARSPGRCSPVRADEDDQASGTIYVLRSKSDHPVVAANRELLHKIGVTGGDVARRIANARLDPTFLMADVEVVATYELYNINRTKLENLIHRIFEPGAARHRDQGSLRTAGRPARMVSRAAVRRSTRRSSGSRTARSLAMYTIRSRPLWCVETKPKRNERVAAAEAIGWVSVAFGRKLMALLPIVRTQLEKLPFFPVQKPHEAG